MRGRKRAGRGLGFAWERGSAGSGRAERLGRLGFGSLGWVERQAGLVCSFPFLVFPSPISPFLFLIQTNTKLGEFKFKFEFTTSTQTNKIMLQHDAITNLNL